MNKRGQRTTEMTDRDFEDPDPETEDRASGEQAPGREGQAGGPSAIRLPMLTASDLWRGPEQQEGSVRNTQS